LPKQTGGKESERHFLKQIRNDGAGVHYSSVAEPEPHHFGAAGAVRRCGSGSGLEPDVQHGKVFRDVMS
jgi:hypothetical protein